MTHQQAELDRLQRYRDAHCESEYEFFPEPVIEDHGKWIVEALLVGAAISAITWFAVGSIMVSSLR